MIHGGALVAGGPVGRPARGGAGSARGAAVAGAGARVVVVDRTPDRAAESADRACALGGICKGVVADVTQEADAERIVSETLDAHGRLDIIINAVGGGAGKGLFDAEVYPREA